MLFSQFRLSPKINLSSFVVYLFGLLSTIFSLRSRAFSDIGDAPAYMRFYIDYLNGIDWPPILAEPTFMLSVKLASLMGEFGIFIILSASITIMVYLIARIHSINHHSVFLFFLLSQFPFIKSYNFLLNAWRTTISISLAYLFIYICLQSKPRHFLAPKILFLFPVILSHTSGPLLILFYFISTYYRRVITSLKKFKLNRKIFLIIFILVLLYVFYFIASTEINYFIRRLEYADSNYIHEQKSIFSLYVKIGLLFLIGMYFEKLSLSKFKSAETVKSFRYFLHFTYLFSVLASFVSTIVSDRIINTTYWISILFLCDILFRYIISFSKHTKLNSSVTQ